MAFTIDATVGGETSNSYVTLDWADTFWDMHYDLIRKTLWQGLDDDPKTLALLDACGVIEQIRFTEPSPKYSELLLEARYVDPVPLDSSDHLVLALPYTDEVVRMNLNQALQFPRSLDIYSDGTIYVPDDVMAAQCYQAVYMMQMDSSVIEKRLQGLTSEAISLAGKISVSQQFGVSPTMLAPMAHQLLNRYFLPVGAKLRRS